MSAAVEIRGDVWWSRLFGRRWLVWTVAVVSTLGTFGAMAYDAVATDNELEIGLSGWVVSASFFGALLTLRVTGNAVGPTLLLTGALGGLAAATGVLLVEDVTHLTVGEAVVYGVSSMAYFSFFWLSMGLLPLIFPTGRPLSPRWGLLGWLGAGTLAVGVIPAVFSETQCTLSAKVEGCAVFAANPIGIPGVEPIEYGALGSILLAMLLIAILGAIISLIVRFFRSRGVERQQIKWVVLVVAANAAILFGFDIVWHEWLGNADDTVFSSVLTFITWTALPVAIAVAIFKYRLYEIDRIVNRTVVYTIVVGLLGALFVAGSVWLPTLLPGESSRVAVAASTLAVAALFNPLRRRVQRFVDRRFYRSRYDAQQVADTFAAGLRDEVDADRVAAQWVDVVRTALQPSSLAVWVKETS